MACQPLGGIPSWTMIAKRPSEISDGINIKSYRQFSSASCRSITDFLFNQSLFPFKFSTIAGSRSNAFCNRSFFLTPHLIAEIRQSSLIK
ncbi:Uncharacterised protein [Neisseria meningitidis]|uniref:Uncharacterized protein n=1 Tax=Neisseria meningitidis TaxID=487 RepID=A0AB33TW88_NEIME|nr:Uncharacterised protein [Neisseria meningitidis]CWP77947.1 Uncharacterised protein [Neisseria meningitidis]CWR82896.1 Uncharacterised protein [Neisseria meningitidis]CWT43839.1 Uncharacterised protein [Neisseria meningitidis]